MLQRLYIHNFRCFENFELILKDMPSALLIGKNGAGKSTVGVALEVLQEVGRGNNRIRDLFKLKNLSYGRPDVPMRFEIEVLLDQKLYQYVLAFELPTGFKESRIFEEQLLLNSEPIYSRKEAQITLYRHDVQSVFVIDWHLVALPIIQVSSETDPLQIFRTWLARMIILAPIPTSMNGDSIRETLEPMRDCFNFGEWFSGLISRYPAAYSLVDKYLHEVVPDIKDIENKLIGGDSKRMTVRFEANGTTLTLNFNDLSDGEKYFCVCAVVLGANKSYGPLFCFWDEPDNYLSISEVGHFVTSLRRAFRNGSQILVTSHHPEAVGRFSNENTFVLGRKNHLDPTRVKLLADISVTGDLIDALICGDIEP